MKFVSALIFLLNLLALPTAAGETAHAKNERDRAYSDVSELFESLARKSEQGQFEEAAQLGVQAREFVLSNTREDSIERAQYFLAVAQLMRAGGYRRWDTLLDFSEQALTAYSRINDVSIDTLLEIHSLYINALNDAWRRSPNRETMLSRLTKLKEAIKIAEQDANGQTSKAAGDLFVTMSRAANSKKKAKNLLSTAIDIYGRALEPNAGLTLWTMAQAARLESEKANAELLLEILPLFKEDDESLQFKAAAHQQLSVLFLKERKEEQSLEQNIAAYHTLKRLGTERKFETKDYLPVVKENPKYPSVAFKKNITGYVILEYTVTKIGSVEDISVLDSEPRKIFDKAAVNAAKKYRYLPRIVDGEPIEVPDVKTRITFDIQ
jgi:TonB family protein